MSEQTTSGPSLQGRTVLVTGGAVRVGAGISGEVAAQGARLAIHCHSHLDQGLQLADKLVSLAEKVQVVCADLTAEGAVQALFDEVESMLGPVSVLVNNAAILATTPLRDFSAGEAEQLVRVNLLAPLRLMAELARRDPVGGVIINIVDAAAQRPWTEHAAYVAAKAGLLAASQVAARELAPRIRVNVVNPGTVELRELQHVRLDALLDRIPLGRIGQAEDIGRAVVFLATSDYATGAVLNIDGGSGLV